MDTRFSPRSHADLIRLIADHPLAWVVSQDFQATPLPLIAETDMSGAIVSLLGHFARRNPPGASRLYFPTSGLEAGLGSHLELRGNTLRGHG